MTGKTNPISRINPARNLEFNNQDDTREFLNLVLEGQPPVRQKCILMNAHQSGIFAPYMDDQDFDTLMSAHGLGGA